MYNRQKEILRKNHVTLVDQLEPRDVFDQLQQDGVLTESDHELINTGKTRKERCRMLLGILPTRGPDAYSSFRNALTQSYSHLDQLLSKTSPVYRETTHLPSVDSIDVKSFRESDDIHSGGICFKCQPYMPANIVNPGLKNALQKCCCIILENVEANDVLDTFYQETLLEINDYECIRSEKTPRDRCVALLKKLSQCPNDNVLTVFKDSLRRKYSFITDMIEEVNNEFLEVSRRLDAIALEVMSREPEVTKVTVTKHLPVPATHTTVIPEVNTVTVTKHIPVPATHTTVIPEVNTVTFDKQCPVPASPTYVLPEVNPVTFDKQCPVPASHTTVIPEVTKVTVTKHIPVPATHTTVIPEVNTVTFDKQCPVPASPTYVLPEVNPVTFDKQCPVPASHTTVITSTSEDGNEISDEHNLMRQSHLVRQRSVQTRFWQSRFSHSKCKIPSTFSLNKPEMCLNISEEGYRNVRASGNDDRRISRKRPGIEVSSPVAIKFVHINTPHCQVFTEPYELRNNCQEAAFNYLSTLVNQGLYKEFEARAMVLRQRRSGNVDMLCIIDYLFASRFLNTADVDSAKPYIKSGLKLAQKSCNPKYFTLEFLTCQTRMLISKKKLGKLQSVLDDAKMIIETDPTCCTGRAAGWLYMNDVKNLMIQISLLNTNRSNCSSVNEHLHEQAKMSCQKSLDHFKRDKGKDGPFGFAFALCRLVIVLLRCGDKGLYKDGITPNPEIVELVGKYLEELEDSDISITTFLRVSVLLAKSDYFYRRKNTQRALEYAEEAFQLAENNSILEFKEQAENRVHFLSGTMEAACKSINEAYECGIMMQCSMSTDCEETA
ncbi:uncharacterized protein LOC117323290 [Pecten maximus]|uniref:uncharacterized protein LOC117323290 n=1 Tax=Pecten maximus TaxID=6579 RepID=UPI001457F98E|nr:uncharacterized protein LOC117323290 [Pecten maximus]